MTRSMRIVPYALAVLVGCSSARDPRATAPARPPAEPPVPEAEPGAGEEREVRLVPIEVPRRLARQHLWLAPGDAFCFPAAQGCPLQIYRGEDVVARDENATHLEILGSHAPEEALARIAGHDGPPLASVDMYMTDLTPAVVDALLAGSDGPLGLGVRGISVQLTDEAIEQLRRLGDRLVALDLAFGDGYESPRRSSPIDLGFLVDLGRVQVLELSGSDAGERPPFESFEPLSRMESLRVLRLDYWPRPEEQAALGQLHQLEELDLVFSSCCLSDVDYSFLEGLPRLMVLRLSGLTLPEDQADHLDALVALREIEVSQIELGPSVIEHLAGLDSLRRVLLLYLRLGDAGLARIARLPRLEGLTLLDAGITDLGMQALADCSALERLELSQYAVTAVGLSALSSVRSLRSLTLAQADDDDLTQVAGLTGLRELSLHGRGISDAGLSGLEALRGLERLELRSTSITDQGLVHVGRLAGLRALGLGNNRIGDDGLAHLDGLRDLELIELMSTTVSREGARAFGERHPGCSVITL